MIRLQGVFLSLAAAGIVAALVMSGRTEGENWGWDPRESQAPLFHSQNAVLTRPSYSSTGPTLRKWADSALAQPVRLATFKPGEVRGVRVSLTMSPDMATAVGENCPLSSVKNGGANSSCSTAADNSGDSSCSVNGVNGGNQPRSARRPAEREARTIARRTLKLNGAAPVSCSASGTGGGANTANACRPAFPPQTETRRARRAPRGIRAQEQLTVPPGCRRDRRTLRAASTLSRVRRTPSRPFVRHRTQTVMEGRARARLTRTEWQQLQRHAGFGSYCRYPHCRCYELVNSINLHLNRLGVRPIIRMSEFRNRACRRGTGGCSAIQPGGGGVSGPPNPATGYCGTP